MSTHRGLTPSACLFAAGACGCFTCTAAHGQSTDAEEANGRAVQHQQESGDEARLEIDGSPIEVTLTPWVWALGMSGDIGAGGTVTDVDVNMIDVIEASDSIFAFSGRLEVHKGRFGGFVDGYYARLGVDNEPAADPSIGDVDIEFDMSIIDFGLSYRLHEWTLERSGRTASLELLGGARYVDLDLELDPDEGDSVSRDKSWIDPIIGARVIVPVADRWQLSAFGDIGGFGVSSDLTWSATAVVGCSFELFSKPSTLLAGYKAISHDFSEGSGDSEFVWDIVAHGPTIGLKIRF